MGQKADTKKKTMKVIVWIVVILALMLTMHILVNYFNMFDFIRSLHGG